MNKTFKRLGMAFVAVLTLATTTSCERQSMDDNPVETPAITLEDVLDEGVVVNFSFSLDGEDYVVSFLKVGDEYVLLDVDAPAVATRADNENKLKFSMEHKKADDQLHLYVSKEDNSPVMTIVIDLKAKTIRVIPANPQVEVPNIKMTIANVEVTEQLKRVDSTPTLADALVKGSTVEITYKCSRNSPTTFTFTYDGQKYSCKITGADASNYEGSSLTVKDLTSLFFDASNWNDFECTLQIYFYTENNTYRFWTRRADTYDSHTISVNGTDITSKLKEVR